MLYSKVIIAASALAGFAVAQNSTLPIPCCTVPVTQVPDDTRSSWCNANENTCVELCGGLSKIASNGNTCDDTSLNYTCKCSNGTDISSALSQYQQTVPSQMCLFWFGACINASGTDASAQFQCNQTRNSQCGSKTTSGSTSSSGGSSATTSGGSPAQTSSSGSGSGSSSSKGNDAAGHLVTYATPILVGGLLAAFGFAL